MNFVKVCFIIIAVLVFLRFIAELVSGIQLMKEDRERGRKSLQYAAVYLSGGILALAVAFFQSEGVL